MRSIVSAKWFRRVALVAAAGGAISALGCAGAEAPSTSEDAVRAERLHLCAAVRGNGQLVGAHFASLATIVDHYGVIDGVAGGSSASGTSFLYDSILLNPGTLRCGGGGCSPEEAAVRVSAALKGVQIYAETAADSQEGLAIQGLLEVANRLKERFDKRGVLAILSLDALRAAKLVVEVLSEPDVRGLINRELFERLKDVRRLPFTIREIIAAVSSVNFAVTDNRLFFRPGPLDWPKAAELMGQMGDFFAGYADPDQLGAWLDVCAAPMRGRVALQNEETFPAGGKTSCESMFGDAVRRYRARLASGAPAARRSRLDDHVAFPGARVKKLISTAVLEGAAVAAYDRGLAAYEAGEIDEGRRVPFDPSFDDVRFGYWGSASDLDRVAANPLGFNDTKTLKFAHLGNAKWREVLTASPAEPGLSRLVKLPGGRYSAGGWSDLAPTLALQNLGCERVVYVTRQGEESFAVGVAKQLGMSEAQWRDIYDLRNPDSATSRSIARANAVWCTDWNARGFTEQRELAREAAAAPLEVRGGWRAAPPLRPYANETERTGLAGCTPGVGASTYSE